VRWHVAGQPDVSRGREKEENCAVLCIRILKGRVLGFGRGYDEWGAGKKVQDWGVNQGGKNNGPCLPGTGVGGWGNTFSLQITFKMGCWGSCFLSNGVA